MRIPAALCLLVLCAPFAGCTSSLDEQDVRAFIDSADEAARKRFAPEICKLRGKNFELSSKTRMPGSRTPPDTMRIERRMFCVEAGRFARIRQYRLERKSLVIQLASDRKTARVVAQYIETAPFYYEGKILGTPDDFYEFQVRDVRDESIVGIESGDVVFLSTDADISVSLVPKASLDIPYD